jgi:amino acid adenylation domain-containing protein
VIDSGAQETMSTPQSTPRLTEVNYDPFDSRELARAVPTTEAQRELWLADQLGREASLAYNESVSLLLEGELDVAVLQDALLALSDRHEALRSTISTDGASLMIAPRGSLQAKIVDLSTLGEAERGHAVSGARKQDVSEPFDLVDGPLMRATLMKLRATRHELLLTAHHIVCDGWSFGVVANELTALYAALSPKKGADALPLADSFGDYAVAQQGPAWLAAAEADTAWWVQQFDGAVPVLELPTDRPRRAFRNFDSLREDLVLDVGLTEAVRKLGSRHGASLFVTLFSVYGALLARLSGQDDIVIGVPSAGQASDGRNALVGHCVQLLPIRMAADLERPFTELLAATRGRVLDAYEHQACTFGQLLKKLQVQRHPGRLPLVSVLFNLDQAIRSEDLSVAGLKVELQSNPRLYENFELSLNASQSDGRLVLECQYNTGLFDAVSVRRWLELYRTALERLVSSAANNTVDAFAPSAADLALLARLNDSALDYPRALSVHALIARQAAATPEHLAVVAGDRRLSYRQLDQRANAVAHALRERGVKAGDLVGLSCGRNEHMLVGLLGILKAGAGYIPMDPAFPAERLEYMCSHSAAAIVVSDASVQDVLKLASAERMLIDALGKRADAPPPAGSVDDVAYVIYTSGSTGKPKGVRVPHRTVTNLLASMACEPGMTAAHVVLSVTTLSFDIAVAELILPLTVGATVVVADRAQTTDGDHLRELIEGEGVDFIQATPSTWRLLLTAGWAGGRHIKALCGGESLPPDLGRELLPRVGELWNCYGPTETTVWSSFHRVLNCDEAVPIGHPAANTQLHVVDGKLRSLPVGVVGEIFIGGEGVTLGYHGRPDLTAERFLPDPHRPGHLWYKTGDLGRWRADGVLECLGRSDHQVKVRGYRIELGEIEASLLALPGIDRAVVITREDEPGDVALAAYVVSQAALAQRTVRDALHKILPDYMVPRHVVQLPVIPLLPNGKVDRQSLPRPQRLAASASSPAATPANPLEAAVLSAFEAALKLPGIGMEDDFFALGGHSLLAATLASILTAKIGRRVALRAVFDSSTARRMAQALSAATAAAPPSGPPSIPVQADQKSAPLTLAQEGIRLSEAVYPGRVTYNTPSAHRLMGPLDAGAFKRALQELVARQPVLRTVIDESADEPVQRVLEDTDVPLQEVDLRATPTSGREAELMARMQAVIDQPIDIHAFPLFKAALYRLDEREHVFLFMPHHIIWDGWSFDILYDELSRLYPAVLRGEETAAPALPISYVDYAHFHHAWLLGTECTRQLEYWKERFARAMGARPLPTDHPRQQRGGNGAAATEWVRIGSDVARKVHALAAHHGATASMFVLAAYATVLSEATGGSSVALGLPVRGRGEPALEGVMGLFVNIVPLVIEIDPQCLFEELLHKTKRETLDAMAHQDVPFERLSAEPEFVSYAKSAGVYQSMFSFQDARARIRTWGPLRHSSIGVMQNGSPSDFGLWLLEVPEGFEGGINYSTALWEASTARVFHRRLLGLIGRALASPHRPLGDLLAEPGEDTEAFASWVRARTPKESAAKMASGASSRGVLDPIVMERRLAEIWSNLLGIDASDVQPTDNFFDLGGSSLLFMRLLAQMKSELGLVVEPRRLLGESLRELVVAPKPRAAALSGARKGG